MTAVLNIQDLFNFEAAISSITELTEILKLEVQYMSENNNTKILENFENFQRKSDLATYVESMKKVIVEHPEIAKTLTEQQKSQLKKVAQDLQAIVTLNNSELMKAKYFNDELIKVVVAAVENASTPMKTYDRYGRRPKISKLKTPTSITLNKKV